MSEQSEAQNAADDGASKAPIPPWLRATANDAEMLEIDVPLAVSIEADCAAFSELYKVAAQSQPGDKMRQPLI